MLIRVDATTDQATSPLVLDLGAASKYLGLSERQMRYMRQCDVGPRCARIGKRLYYLTTDLEAWVNDQFEAEQGRGA